MEKLGILSKHIILTNSNVPIYGLISIQNELIQDIFVLEPSFSAAQVQARFSQWRIFDYSDSYISPGIVDLNVRKEWDSYSALTKAAISGGTTFILEEPSFYNPSAAEEDLYCDVGAVQVLNSRNMDAIRTDVLALKAYLFQPCASVEAVSEVTRILELSTNQNLPLFVDPNLPDPRMLYMASPLRLESTEEHKEKSVSGTANYAAAFGDATNSGESEDSSDEGPLRTVSLLENEMKIFSSNKEFDENELEKQRVSIAPDRRDDNSLTLMEIVEVKKERSRRGSRTIYDDVEERVKKSEKNIENLCMAEKSTYEMAGSTKFVEVVPEKATAVRRRPPGLALKAEVKAQPQTDYTFFLANCPESWEKQGIELLLNKLQKDNKVHIQNISSAGSVNLILKKASTHKNLTCEIPASHLFFNSSSIEKHDTRFKCCPPVRNAMNFNLLWELLKMKGIHSISSHHVFIDKSHKAMETKSFQNALNGICSIQFTLQAVWSVINIPFMKPE
jgi:dihydroorotase-like cyclic amidohydrolase